MKLIGVFLLLAAATAAADYQQRSRELSAAYIDDDAAQQVEMLLSFFGISPPEIGEEPLDRDFFDGLSDRGYRWLRKAREDEVARMVDELNCGKLSVAKLCQIIADQGDVSATFVAEQRAAQWELALQRKLTRYNAVFDGLSQRDQAVVMAFNRVAFGHERPAMSDHYRDMLMTLANEFPEKFTEEQTTECVKEQRDDGKLLLLPQETRGWQNLSPLAMCEKTQAHAKQLMLVCPENFDPQDEVQPCNELLSTADAQLAE